MNTLYIIGNGFDLAHGLKTSYSDFLLWYLKDCLEKLDYNDNYNDSLLTIQGSVNLTPIIHLKTIEKIFNYCSQNSIKINYISPFSRRIFTGNSTNWVDLESLYYSSLLESLNFHRTSENERDNYVDKLNQQFDYLRKKLIEYLNEIDKTVIKNEEIQSHFEEDAYSNYKNDKHCVLNFNYTLSVEQYLSHNPSIKCLNIHGLLNDPGNPIIFGYGDEMHPDYEKLERFDRDNYLIYFKSFGYLRNRNYVLLLNFLNYGAFRVKIMGHSCGLSDRVLLSTIFEHQNCIRIEICYHKISESKDDHYEKTIRISRHFSTSKKEVMRSKVQNYRESKCLLSPE